MFARVQIINSKGQVFVENLHQLDSGLPDEYRVPVGGPMIDGTCRMWGYRLTPYVDQSEATLVTTEMPIKTEEEELGINPQDDTRDRNLT